MAGVRAEGFAARLLRDYDGVMANGKWITGLKPDMDPREAAVRVLEKRLQAVRLHFRPAVEVLDADVEHVHQLRVATRRCRAALDAFADVLRSATRERLRKLLRAIRRAAGPARDADVLLLDLSSRVTAAPAGAAPGIHWAAGQLMARRTSAQEQLEEAYHELGPDLERLKIEALSGKEVRKTTLGRMTLKQMARHVLREHLTELESTGRSARKQEQLHRMRIAGKRLRYAMEIFGDCFGTEFRKVLYPRVEALQEILGTVNDAYNAAQTYRDMEAACRRFFPGLWPQWREGVRYLISEQVARQKRAMNEFKQFWRQWRKEDVAGHFDAVLS